MALNNNMFLIFQGHCPHVPRARLLQEEGRRRPGGAVQRDEGLLRPRQGGRILPGVGLHRRAAAHAGARVDSI